MPLVGIGWKDLSMLTYSIYHLIKGHLEPQLIED